MNDISPASCFKDMDGVQIEAIVKKYFYLFLQNCI